MLPDSFLGFALNFSIPLNEKEKGLKNILEPLGYQHVGTGGSRITFLTPDKKYVVKFPWFEYGILVNKDEHHIWHKYKNNPEPTRGMVFAPCRLIYGSILIMRAVSVLCGNAYGDRQGRKVIEGDPDLPNDAPPWASLVDCHQVGKLPNGRWVAYDYGDWFGNI